MVADQLRRETLGVLPVQDRTEVSTLYRVRGTPSAVLIDSAGRIAAPLAVSVAAIRVLLTDPAVPTTQLQSAAPTSPRASASPATSAHRSRRQRHSRESDDAMSRKETPARAPQIYDKPSRWTAGAARSDDRHHRALADGVRPPGESAVRTCP
jgi:hypothetical protein